MNWKEIAESIGISYRQLRYWREVNEYNEPRVLINDTELDAIVSQTLVFPRS